MPDERNKNVIRRVIAEGVNAGNLAVIDEMVDPTYVGTDPNLSGPMRGPEGVKEAVRAARTAFPDLQVAIDELLVHQDRVAGRITIRGTHLGPLGAILPTGRRVTIAGMFVRRLEEGRLVEGWDLADMAGLMRQLGLAAPASQEV